MTAVQNPLQQHTVLNKIYFRNHSCLTQLKPQNNRRAEMILEHLKWSHCSEEVWNVTNRIFPIGVACFSSFRRRVSREMSVLSEKAYLSVCLLLAEVKWQWKFYVGQTKSQTSGDGKTSWQASRFPPAGLSVSMQTSNASSHLEKKH